MFQYPRDLSTFVSNRWNTEESHGPISSLLSCGSNIELVEQLVSTSFQASLLKDELRQVTFRIIVSTPYCFEEANTSQFGFHILRFSIPRPFTSLELRSLSQAATFNRSLIGVQPNSYGELEIWGIVHTGPHWLREMYGGRKVSPPLPTAVVICVNGPGYIEVCKGSVLVGQLREGSISDGSMNVFDSHWLPQLFVENRNEILALHASRAQDVQWATLDPNIIKILSQQMIKRVLAAVQASHHGGSIIFIPPQQAEVLSQLNSHIDVKYQFAESEARGRYRSLILAVMKLMATRFAEHPHTPIGVREYEQLIDQAFFELDDALFEMSYLVASLTAVDGAVLMTKRFELLGFGAEITCHQSKVFNVHRALDLEGEKIAIEPVDGVGTRHRSVYRFVTCNPDSLTIVISQDGDVRFVTHREDSILYWNHRPSLQATP